MKKIITVILLTLSLSLMCGCSGKSKTVKQEDIEDTTKPFKLETVGTCGDFNYIRDKVTDVIYLCFDNWTSQSGTSGLTVMLDPDTGLPLTYSRYVELYKNLNQNSE